MVHPYLRRRAGLEPITYPDPAIQSVLESTLGVPIFQEQVIRLAMVAAGFSGGEADSLRRAITNWGKNSKLLTFENKLKTGMLNRGYSAEFADQLFNQIKGFGGYGFPESHSASFALLAYVSAWFKRHHPGAFYVGLLNSQPMGFYTPSQLIQDAERHGISALPVDVNASEWDHQLLSTPQSQQKTIRLGLRLVKGLSKRGAEQLIDARRTGLFQSVIDLKRRAKLDKDDLEALSAADTLSSLSGHRHKTHWAVMAVKEAQPLLMDEHPSAEEGAFAIAPPSMTENVLFDYQSTGLTLRTHPGTLTATIAVRSMSETVRAHHDG